MRAGGGAADGAAVFLVLAKITASEDRRGKRK